MRLAAAALAVMSLDLQGAEGDKTLTLPRALHTGEIVVIQVQVGTLARGQEVHVTTDTGRELGVISPFGVKSGKAAGTYPIPVPPDAITGKQLTVHLTITSSGTPARAPTTQEIPKVEIVIGGSATGTSGNKGEEK